MRGRTHDGFLRAQQNDRSIVSAVILLCATKHSVVCGYILASARSHLLCATEHAAARDIFLFVIILSCVIAHLVAASDHCVACEGTFCSLRVNTQCCFFAIMLACAAAYSCECE